MRPVVISTLLSLLVVGAAVAAVAYLVLRSPSTAVDSAERLEPVGTALPAPSEPPTLPTPIPTTESDSNARPEPTALGFTGEAPVAWPTVANRGRTPTGSDQRRRRRVIALPTECPLTAVPPQPTLPPAVPVDSVPVVALAPVESAPPPAPTAAASQSQAVTQPTPVPVEVDDDPFSIFGNEQGRGSSRRRTTPSIGRGPCKAARTRAGIPRRQHGQHRSSCPLPSLPTTAVARARSRLSMPDVDAMIDDITARATIRTGIPNVGTPAGQFRPRPGE